ncbi:MAG TPA: hypothetical protein PKA00_20035 [Saprospiraceae bacterium]|nr:hypothetical protein [Saprospiraceae bacterium]HMQ85211.1 hypothetical protein [Saprospiraceae bacterium]
MNERLFTYKQTPIELFPFSSIDPGGIHYGFVIHTAEDDDYRAGEICPMDDDGVVVISNHTTDLFQNFLCDISFFDSYPALAKQLKLTNKVIDRERYGLNEKTWSVSVKPKHDWAFMNTKDGAGVFA